VKRKLPKDAPFPAALRGNAGAGNAEAGIAEAAPAETPAPTA
jgi:hypothetical protein